MKTAGIIAEYNPFHSGHARQIRLLKEQGFDAVVCVCSPGVVQRGTAALFPASVRTRAALLGGADLIISLPAPYATLSAEGFALAGISLLNALGCVDAVCFGTEAQSVQEILQAAGVLTDASFAPQLRERLDAGMPAAAARAAAAEALMPGVGAVLARPNDILGVEYCKALKKLGSKMQPLALVRRGAPHDAPLDLRHGKYASASALRGLVQQKGAFALEGYVPDACLALYKKAQQEGAILDERAFGTAILSRLRTMSAKEMGMIRGAAEGLENRLYAAVQESVSLPELLERMKTKRYPTARLRRLILDAALNVQSVPELPPYLHVLGASEAGLRVLNTAKQTASLPLSHSLARLSQINEAAAKVAGMHSAAQDLTALCLVRPRPCKTAYTDKPVFGDEIRDI